MIARFQKYRRTEVFLEAVQIIVKEFPNIKVLLVGRSSQMEKSVIKPIKRLRIEPWVVLGGYRTEDYMDTLACMDIFVFLMAGSDGTARAQGRQWLWENQLSLLIGGSFQSWWSMVFQVW